MIFKMILLYPSFLPFNLKTNPQPMKPVIHLGNKLKNPPVKYKIIFQHNTIRTIYV